MKERPIIFNAEMVRAILSGQKTQTRRAVANVRPDNCLTLRKPTKTKAGTHTHVIDAPKHGLCPFGKVGDRLWVREAHAFVPEPAYRRSTGITQTVNPNDDYQASIYRENFDRCSGGIKWRPSIHMPRWASRIQLEITNARVERLKDISNEDAQAEGMTFTDYGLDRFGNQRPGWLWRKSSHHEECLGSAKWAFANLWESIYGEESWRSNPWVWVIEFKRIEGGAA